MQSFQFTLDSADLVKIGKGALLAGGAAAITYLVGALPGVNFGPYTGILVPILSVALNLVRKWLAGPPKPPAPAPTQPVI